MGDSTQCSLGIFFTRSLLEAEWTYRFFRMWKIRNTELYLEGFLHEIHPIYSVEESVSLELNHSWIPYDTSSATRVAYFPYVTFVSVVSFNDVTIPAFCVCCLE